MADIAWHAARTTPSLLAAILAAVIGAGRAGARPLNLQPMTQVGVAAHTGYMSDPYPIRRSPSVPDTVQHLSGTTPNLLACDAPIRARCFTSTQATVDASWVMPRIKHAGMTFHGLQNRDIFQDDDGRWHMVVAVDFGPDKQQNRTLIAHASPTGGQSPDTVPTTWAVDQLLVGSFSVLAQGNYDCKYFEDKGRLYLLYVANLEPDPLVNGIVIQPMLSPTRLASAGPTLLLSPQTRGGGFSSEQFANTTAKLVEAENIQVINGKYAMAYSTGSYLTEGYKAGVAWSDTLLPAPGHEYRRVLAFDYGNVWNNPSRIDVHYLMQSQHPDWPNYTGDQVIGPGVNSFVEGPGRGWHMYFNAYDPGDLSTGSALVEADHRRPYFVRFRANVPDKEPVAAASDADLANWIVPETR